MRVPAGQPEVAPVRSVASAVIECIPLVVLCLDADQRVVYANQYASRVLGMPIDVLQDRAYLEVHPDESKALRDEFAQMVADGDPVRIGPRSAEFRVRRADGEWRWLRALSAAYRDESGEFRVVTMSEDITELRAIQRVHARQNRTVATFTIDLSASPPRIVSIDHVFERICGFAQHEIVGTPVTDLFARLYEPGRTELLRIFSEARLGREGNVQVFWQSVAGVDMRATLRLIPIAVGELATGLAMGIVASTGPAAAEAVEAQSQIADRLLALGRFSTNLSHELNNPLGAILLSSERAARLSHDATVRECIDEVVREAKRCSEIVKSLYRFARGEESTRSLCDINRIVRCAIDAHRGSFTRPRVKDSLRGDLPMLSVDPVAIELALVNLIRNAHEASDPDSVIEIATGVSQSGVEIQIADRGHGIRPDARPHIFEPFYSTRTDHGGCGIGLSVVHGIVSSHRGAVGIEDRVGGGTIVTVWLPHPSTSEGV